MAKQQSDGRARSGRGGSNQRPCPHSTQRHHGRGGNHPRPCARHNTIPDLLILSPTPTIDPNSPTATPTPIVVRAFITGTGGNGVNFRATPGGELIEILADDTFVTMVDGEAGSWNKAASHG